MAVAVLVFVILGNCNPLSKHYSQISNESSFYLKSDYFNAEPEANIGYGQCIIFSFLNLNLNKSSVSSHQTNANKFIIILSLLMSGDIHPCPAPNRENLRFLYNEWCFQSCKELE